MKSLTLIDGSGFIFRAYHSMPPLTNLEGTPVGAVYGFINMLMRYMDNQQTDAVLVVFDAARYNFRNRIYAEYKANRDETPEDLVPQFALTRDAAEALGLPIARVEDVEADDVIASYARHASNEGIDVTIVSSDKDLMQLVDDDLGIHMYDPMKQKLIKNAEVEEKFGVEPVKVLDILSLMGDSSDNIPGVPGIGPKTATLLIQEYGDLDTLLARASEVKQNKRRESLIEFADQARMSRQLATLKEDVELPHALDALALKAPDPEQLGSFLAAQGFKSLINKVKNKYGLSDSYAAATASGAASADTPAASPQASAAVQAEYTLVQDEGVLKDWIKQIEHVGRVVLDVETTSLDAMTAELVGISLCVEAGKACYIPFGHINAGGNVAPADDLFAIPKSEQLQAGQLDKARVLELLKPIFADEAILKIGHNMKYDALVLKQAGVDVAPVGDTMLMSYALHAGEHAQGMDYLSERYLGVKPISFDEVTGKGKSRISFAEVALEAARDYAAEDADITMRLYQLFAPKLHTSHVQALYSMIEQPMIAVVTAMERRGVKVDEAMLKQLSTRFESEMATLEKTIHSEAGAEFNIGSPKQLGEILFDKMGIEGGKKSAKTGAYSTGAEKLEELADQGIAIAGHVLEWRQLAKLKSTYTDALVRQINPDTKRVHTSYSLATTSTGRFSSSDPNLQNIPIRTELGRLIRTAFVAEEGNVLISADYSQIELRLLAHMAEIEPLQQAFKEGRDIHAATAADMFGHEIDAVPDDARRQAKMINFGIIYGISAHGLATRLGITRPEAAEYIERYFARYPGIRKYMESTKEFGREHGYVETLFGRRCHVPAINDKNGARRQFGERAAINAPLQGTAADIIKRAMIAVENDLAAYMPECKMLLQVHDELIFEVPRDKVDAAMARIIPLMENAASLSVPLTVEAKAGAHWGEAH